MSFLGQAKIKIQNKIYTMEEGDPLALTLADLQIVELMTTLATIS